MSRSTTPNRCSPLREVNLQKVTVGIQQQQKEQAKDQLLQQQANYDNALTGLQSGEKQLYNQGAAAKADLDNSATQVQRSEGTA